MDPRHVGRPQVTTGPRLLRLGESAVLRFHLPEGVQGGELRVFPRYLDTAEPGEAFRADGDLSWIDALDSETLAESMPDAGETSIVYTPKAPGSYLFRWTAGGETFYRYFAAIEDDWVVMRLHTHLRFDPQPTLHAIGIPLSYRLPVEVFTPDLYFYEIGHEFAEADPMYQKYLGYHRHYGDTIIPDVRDTPDMGVEERAAYYAGLLDKARAMLVDPRDAQTLRVEKAFMGDRGYAETLNQLPIIDHEGMWVAHGGGWLGMPEFPYFMAPDHALRPNQGVGGRLIGHQWDFAGSFHFLGPADWHYSAAEGDWRKADACLRRGIAEAALAAKMSGHPVFFLPLYDGAPDRPTTNPRFDAQYRQDHAEGRVHAYIEHYLRMVAFEFPKRYKTAFARTVDIADYYRRHFHATPRTVFSCRTDHILYDGHWMDTVHDPARRVTRERLAWDTTMSEVQNARKTGYNQKDPYGMEFVLVEDQRRQMRFDRECPNPVWWFDYTDDAYWTDDGSRPTWKVTPDVQVVRSVWERDGEWRRIRLTMKTDAEFEGYAICLWDVPAAYSTAPDDVRTNADSAIRVVNTEGDYHLVLCFDLKPGVEIEVAVRDLPRR